MLGNITQCKTFFARLSGIVDIAFVTAEKQKEIHKLSTAVGQVFQFIGGLTQESKNESSFYKFL